jgi:putative transcriptional regulator
MSELLDIAHDMAKSLFNVGAMDEITLREVEALCLSKKKKFEPDEIRLIRQRHHISQEAFAALLGIEKTTVQQWELGVKSQVVRPNDCLMSLTVKDWTFFRESNNLTRRKEQLFRESRPRPTPTRSHNRHRNPLFLLLLFDLYDRFPFSPSPVPGTECFGG